MTDKQIIIDVTQCPSYKEMEEQLKRKEQKCEELKEQLAEMISQSALLPKFFGLTADEITNMLQEYDRLKVENLSLKRGIEIAKEADKSWISQLKAENDLFRTCHDNEQAKRRKLEQTLTEIKEIAEKRNYLDYNECLDDILQKISECEGNDE